jgi:hypothetical protein
LDANHVIASLDSVDATGVTGILTLNLGDSGATAGADIATGAGTNTIYLSQGDDVVTLSYDSDDYYGTDIIYLNDAAATSVEIEGLETGSSGDVIELDLSALELNKPDGTNVVTLVNPEATGADTSTDTLVFSVLTGVKDLDSLSSTNILVLDGDIDSASDLETQLSLNGDFALTLGADLTNDDGFLVLWDDGPNSYLSIVANTSGATISNADTLTTAELTVVTVITFVGIADCTDINASNLGTTFNA